MGEAPSLFGPIFNINRSVNGFGEKQDHGEQKGADYLYLSIFGTESAFCLLFL